MAPTLECNIDEITDANYTDAELICKCEKLLQKQLNKIVITHELIKGTIKYTQSKSKYTISKNKDLYCAFMKMKHIKFKKSLLIGNKVQKKTLEKRYDSFSSLVEAILIIAQEPLDKNGNTLSKDQFEIVLLWFAKYMPKQVYAIIQKIKSSTAIKAKFWRTMLELYELTNLYNDMELEECCEEGCENNELEDIALNTEGRYCYILQIGGVYLRDDEVLYAFKIGKSIEDLFDRFRSHYKKKAYPDITIIKIFKCSDPHRLEKALHVHLKQYHVDKNNWMPALPKHENETFLLPSIAILRDVINRANKVVKLQDFETRFHKSEQKVVNLENDQLALLEKTADEKAIYTKYRSTYDTWQSKMTKAIEQGDLKKINHIHCKIQELDSIYSK